MIKNILRKQLRFTSFLILPIYILLNKLNEKFDFVYSEIYCRIFKCKDVFFGKPVNTIRGERYFIIGKKVRFGKFAVLTAWDEYAGDHFSPKVTIGDNCSFGDYLHLTCANKITIGDGVLTGRWVTIADNSHGTSNEIVEGLPPVSRKLYSKGPICIEDNVWIGDKVTILPGVTIGKNSIIAANAVITKNIPENCIAAGNPATIIKRIK